MASLQYWSFAWVSTEGNEMPPGATHYWEAFPFQWGDVVSFTAHAVSGDPDIPDSKLIVENVYTDADPHGQRTVLFNVRNLGNDSIVAYRVGSSIVNS